MLRDLPRDQRRPRSARPNFEPLEGRALLAALMVTNTLDSGAGSLRQALLDATSTAAASTISFAIPGPGVHTISPGSNLPNINEPVTIDGTTQPGYAGTPVVAIDGAAGTVSIGLDFMQGSSASVVKGLAIDRFGYAGIFVQGPRVTIQSNSLGLDPAGLAGGTSGSGIVIDDNINATGDAGSVISGNVIAANGDGIVLGPAFNATISNNFIGTDATGRADVGNVRNGIVAQSLTAGVAISGNTIADNGERVIVDQSGGGLTLANNTLANNGTRYVNLAVVASSTALATATGQTIATSYTVTNTGPATATNVRLGLVSQDSQFFVSPAGLVPSPVLRFTGGSASQGTATTGYLAQSVQAALGTLAPGASATVTVTARVIGSGKDSIDAVVSSDNPTTAPPGSVASTAVTATGTADLAVVASPPPPARVGAPETFTFVVTNHDPTYSTDALFALQVQAPIFYPGIGSAPGSARTGALVCQGTVATAAAGSFDIQFYTGDLGTLPPGASAVVTAVVIPPVGGVVSAILYAYSASDVDPNPTNNLAYAAAQAAGAAPASSSPILIGADAVTSSATGPITSIQVNFQGPLNASTAQNVGNYSLTTTGSSARIKIASASYSVTTLGFSVVTLRLARPQPRSGAPLQLVVNGPGSPGLTGVNSSARLPLGTLTIPR